MMRVIGDINIERAIVADTMLNLDPEVVLFDLDPHSDILGAIGSIQKVIKDSVILVLTDLADHELARKALSHGASGVVLRIQPPAVLITAIQDLCPRYSHQAMPGRLAADVKETKIQQLLKTQVPTSKDRLLKIDTLTTREREIIGLVGLGLKNKDIANRLCISDITVRHHLSSIFCKLEVSDRQKLLIVAHRYGLADLTLSAESA
jgi:DNA-binding NarL/FixJ family response regulator